MEAAWRFRIMFVMAFVVIIFGDFLGYGNAKVDKGRESTPHLDFNDDSSHSASEQLNHHRPNQILTKENSQKNVQIKLTEALRESCLPKLLCEMAARPDYTLSDREKNLLGLIKSTTMSLTMAVSPTRWHFAAHMGQLLRNTIDNGCSELFPLCPFSSQKLMRMSGRVTLK